MSSLTTRIQAIGSPYPQNAAAGGTVFGATPPKALMERRRRLEEYLLSFEDGWELARAMAAADEADPVNVNVWCAAEKAFSDLAEHLPAPLVHPLQLGGVSVEWHAAGLNIEVRFRGTDDIFVIVEDARSDASKFYGSDPTLKHAGSALRELARRHS